MKPDTKSQPLVKLTVESDQSLPLTPFERFIYDSEDSLSPMTFRVLMKFRGSVNRDLLALSYQKAVARHALLNRVIDDSSGTAVWKVSPAPRPPLQWRSQEAVDESPLHGLSPTILSLRDAPGLHTEILTASNTTVANLNFHHACCDGQAARQLIIDWFHLYDRLVKAESPDLSVLDPERLNLRGIIRARPGIYPVGFKEGLRNFYATVSGRTVRLPNRKIRADSIVPGAAHLCERILSEDQTAVLRQHLKQDGVSINDLGIAVAMLAVATLYPSINSRHQITVLNPVDLRLPSDRFLPAANRTGFTYLRRRPEACRNLRDLLTSVREETTYIKSRYVGAEFIHGLTSASRWPGLLTLIRKTGLFTPTVQFTCLGDCTRGKRHGIQKVDNIVTFGDLKLEHISGFAPVAPGVPFSITACETNSRLSITVGSGQQFASREDGKSLADFIVDSICTWTGLQ
jgi:hypothetical protein